MNPGAAISQTIGILLGVLLSGATSLCLGTLLFRKLSIKLERLEHFPLAFVVGSACFSQIVFLGCSLGLARKSVFIAIGLLAAVTAAVSIRAVAKSRPSAAQSLPFKWLFLPLFASFGVVYLVNAAAPEMSPDGSAYHLPVVMRYLRAHGFERITGNFYASLSQGIELLFLPAFSLGRHSAATMVHLLFLFALPLMMFAYGRRFGFPVPAAASAFLVFASPVVGRDGTSAYVDVAAAGVLFALFFLLQVWDLDTRPHLLVPIGILAGFSYATKYTAAIAIPYTVAVVAWKLWRARKPLARPLFTICALAAFFILPWMVKNVVFVGNPIAPFANRLFPNPYLHVGFEEQYRSQMRQYHSTGWQHLPWELTVKGERLQGFLGPVFLLAPAAVLSLRRPGGRRLLLAGAVFALPWLLNIGTRFLIPALPLFTLALGLSLARPAGLLPAIAVLHAFLSWFGTPFHYFDSYAPRITRFPWRAALRIEPEEVYLARNHPAYLIDRMIEDKVPPDQSVFSFGAVPESWTTRQILVAYNSAGNEKIADIVWAALFPDRYPSRALHFRFEPRTLRRVRAIQTARVERHMWSVSEFDLLQGGQRLLRGKDWQLKGDPNPWDLPLAFDGSPVTRWRSWRGATPGMFVEVALDEPTVIDEVRLLTTPDALQARVELRGMDAHGAWHSLSSQSSLASLDIADNLRHDAVKVLMERGIRYLLVLPDTFGANDFQENTDAWGIQLAGESNGTRLYFVKGIEEGKPPRDPVWNGLQAVAPAGTYDDPDSRLSLRRAWTRDTQFQDAHSHTLTYSNVPGASISLAFKGNAVTYIYTCARNRGTAEVWIDGRLKDRLDLYSPQTAWQRRTTYNQLGSGEHKFEVRVTGQRNALARDCFVDLDGLIVE